MDDYDRSMTPRACETEDTKADLALSGVACLARDVSAAPSPELANRDPAHSGPAPGNENNKSQQASDELAPPSNRPSTKPLGHTDVFVDDFIQLGQGGTQRMQAIRRHLWHAVDQVLAQPAETNQD